MRLARRITPTHSLRTCGLVPGRYRAVRRSGEASMKGWEWWRGRRPDLAITAGLVAAVLFAFSGALNNGFVSIDDTFYITWNAVTQRGLSASTATWAFTTVTAANWHPLTWLSLMLDVDLFGLHPAGHHAMSLGLHGLNTALVFAFMRRLGTGRGPSAFAAGLFGLHPLHVESVAWAAERKDVLSMAFGLLTLLAYVRYAEAPSRGRMTLVTGLLILGLMAKPMLVTLPFVLLLLDWWPLRRVESPAWIASPEVAPGETLRVPLGGTGARMRTEGGRKRRRADRRRDRGRPDSGRRSELQGTSSDRGDSRVGRGTSGRLLLEKAPLFAVVLLSCAVTYLVQKGAIFQRLPIPSRLENAVHSYVVYLEKFIFPTDLACFYPFADLGAGRVALSVAMLAGLTLTAWRLRTTRPYVLVGWLWFVGALVPMIGLVQVGGQAYADRYTYFPALGLGFVASLGLADAVGRARLPRPAQILAGGAVLTVLGVATWRQTLVWRDGVSLYQHTLAVTEHNWWVRLFLAGEYIEANELQRAEAMLQQALSEGAPPARVHMAMSAIYYRERRAEDALHEIDAALAVESNDPQMLVNRGIYLIALHRDAEAVAVLQRAIALDQGIVFDPEQRDAARRAVADALHRLGGEERPEAVPTAPR